MNTEEQLLLGFIGLLAVACIVVLIVLMVKKNGGDPCPGAFCKGDSQYNCGFYKNKNDCNEAGPTDVPGGCKWTCPTPGPTPKPSSNNNNNGICCDNGSGYPNCSLDKGGNNVKKEECLNLAGKCDWKSGSTTCPDSKLKGSCNPTIDSQRTDCIYFHYINYYVFSDYKIFIIVI